MSSSASTSKKEADFRLWTLLLAILAGHSPIEDLLGHHGFQSQGKQKCAKVMCKYRGIMRMYYGASYDEDDLFSEASTRMINFWHKREADNNAPCEQDFLTEHEFWGWFFVLALNIIRSKLRKFKELRAEGLTLIHVPIDDLSIADHHVQPEWECFLKQFLEFTATLPLNRRRATQLWYEGYSTREIKALLHDEQIECSNVAVLKWVKASLKAFAESLKRDQDGGENR
jgi:hypothetical protein